MLKYSSIAAVLGVLVLGTVDITSASAAQGPILPGGDALDFTPPQDVTESQVQAAPRRDRRKYKAIKSGTYVPKKHSHRIGVTARGQ